MRSLPADSPLSPPPQQTPPHTTAFYACAPSPSNALAPARHRPPSQVGRALPAGPENVKAGTQGHRCPLRP